MGHAADADEADNADGDEASSASKLARSQRSVDAGAIVVVVFAAVFAVCLLGENGAVARAECPPYSPLPVLVPTVIPSSKRPLLPLPASTECRGSTRPMSSSNRSTIAAGSYCARACAAAAAVCAFAASSSSRFCFDFQNGTFGSQTKAGREACTNGKK
jgi:hypothetical protein